MKTKKKKTLVIILIILLIIGIYFLLKNNSNFFKDDIILFKNFYSSIYKNNIAKEKNTNDNEYNNIIEISTKNRVTKEMSLFSNLENQINWNETIYPGTKGEFPIKLYAKENLQYEITFKSKNQKPKNLVFKQNGKEYETLEKLGEDLTGNLQKEEIKNIVIEWKWEYETNEEQDMQDTSDGKQLQEYKFDVVVRSE